MAALFNGALARGVLLACLMMVAPAEGTFRGRPVGMTREVPASAVAQQQADSQTVGSDRKKSAATLEDPETKVKREEEERKAREALNKAMKAAAGLAADAASASAKAKATANKGLASAVDVNLDCDKEDNQAMSSLRRSKDNTTAEARLQDKIKEARAAAEKDMKNKALVIAYNAQYTREMAVAEAAKNLRKEAKFRARNWMAQARQHKRATTERKKALQMQVALLELKRAKEATRKAEKALESVNQIAIKAKERVLEKQQQQELSLLERLSHAKAANNQATRMLKEAKVAYNMTHQSVLLTKRDVAPAQTLAADAGKELADQVGAVTQALALIANYSSRTQIDADATETAADDSMTSQIGRGASLDQNQKTPREHHGRRHAKDKHKRKAKHGKKD